MRRAVLAQADGAGGAANVPAKGFSVYQIAIGAFVAIYIVGQLVLLVQSGSSIHGDQTVVRNAVRYHLHAGHAHEEASVDPITSAGRGAPAAPKPVEVAAQVVDSAAASEVETDISTTAGDGEIAVTDGGPNFMWESIEEPPYPSVPIIDEATPVLSAHPHLADIGAAYEATAKRLQDEAPAGQKVQLPPRGALHVYESTSVTTGHPCWTSSRLLYAMGLDRMAAHMNDAPPPRDLQRSRVQHPLAPVAADLFCAFHSTPVSGGLQCCCHSNVSTSDALKGNVQGGAWGAADSPGGGTFFCLPSMVFAGARGTGAGRLYALFHQHAYLQSSPAPPPHTFSTVRHRTVVDGVMPRYVGHLSSQMPAEWAALPTFEERNKVVASKFWIDASPSYFYGLISPMLLRKLLPRGKVILLLRDPVERAYQDVVRVMAAQNVGKEAEAALEHLLHACMKAVACSAHGASGGLGVKTTAWGSAGSLAFQQCLKKGAAGVPALASVAAELSGEDGADSLSCLASTLGPAGNADWSIVYGVYAGSDEAKEAGHPFTCSAAGVEGGDSSGVASAAQSSAVIGEATAVFDRLTLGHRRQIVGCLPPAALGRDFASDVAALKPAAISSAVEKALAQIERCSQVVEAGTALPVPTDLMAGVVAGYELNLVGVSTDMPKSFKGKAKVLLDGAAECFPSGVDGFGPDSVAHAIARSLYLRPLQRIHAAYGREVVQLYDSTSLRSRPLSVLEPIWTDINVYKPTIEPSKLRTQLQKMQWRGEEGELDAEPAGTVPDMSEELKARLTEFFAPHNAALMQYLGPELSKKLTRQWALPEGAQAE